MDFDTTSYIIGLQKGKEEGGTVTIEGGVTYTDENEDGNVAVSEE